LGLKVISTTPMVSMLHHLAQQVGNMAPFLGLVLGVLRVCGNLLGTTLLSELARLVHAVDLEQVRALEGVVWCGVVLCLVVWCLVVWCGVVWCGAVWHGKALYVLNG